MVDHEDPFLSRRELLVGGEIAVSWFLRENLRPRVEKGSAIDLLIFFCASGEVCAARRALVVDDLAQRLIENLETSVL